MCLGPHACNFGHVLKSCEVALFGIRSGKTLLGKPRTAGRGTEIVRTLSKLVEPVENPFCESKSNLGSTLKLAQNDQTGELHTWTFALDFLEERSSTLPPISELQQKQALYCQKM